MLGKKRQDVFSMARKQVNSINIINKNYRIYLQPKSPGLTAVRLRLLYNGRFGEMKGLFSLFEHQYVNMVLKVSNKAQATPPLAFNLPDYADIT